ncbi:hypothetical protein [Actinotalea sp. K2]|uniref:hypothetical protein n=1 Tax=Actinotalea sp. K2 TaxID=2939438 RepID=UPI002016B8E6|nr:hypothetical protein [Actinotalea sp. K2]MCL3859561.1 hypothetical protein [Actinotalea sp. K2]
MDDDVILARLRRLADAEPPVAVDRAGVLLAGRRRRLARKAGTVGAVLAITLGAYPVAGALIPDPAPVAPAVPSPTETTAPPARAAVDHEAGTITLPMDEVGLDPHDSAVTRTAYLHFFSTCMGERGFGELWEFEGLVPEQRWESLPYGMWQESDVRQNGYGPLLEHHAETQDPRPPDDGESEAASECTSALVDAGLDFDSLALMEKHRNGDIGWRPAFDTDEGRAIIGEWHQCLTDGGVLPPQEDWEWLPPAVLEAPIDEQIRIGLVDVSCKEHVDLVQRMGDLDAVQQATALERDAEYYAELRSMEEAVVERARVYLEEHGISNP